MLHSVYIRTVGETINGRDPDQNNLLAYLWIYLHKIELKFKRKYKDNYNSFACDFKLFAIALINI